MPATETFCVRDFLAACARSFEPGEPPMEEAFTLARDALLAGGLPAVRALSSGSTWLQLGVAVPPGRGVAFYQELSRAAVALLDGAENFFFMHKPPGFRIRFEVTAARRATVLNALTDWADGCRAAGMVASVTPARYEPEAHLFGGPVSMRSVHRLFTADSLAWLGYHALTGGAAPPGPDWAFSLAVLRGLFDALGVVGWEDRDVWHRVRTATGRRLPPGHLAVEGFGAAATSLRRLWTDPARLRAQLSPQAVDHLTRCTAAMAEEGPRWQRDYFATPDAYVGPREAAAFFAVYHWNRGGLSMARQCMLAEALAGPMEPSP